MKFLHIIGTLDPNYGGPVEGLLNLATTLELMGNSVEIISLDHLQGAYSIPTGIIVHKLGQFNGNYRFTFHLIPWLRNNISRFDVIIVHGIWQYQSLAVWLMHKKLKIPYFIFVHGALDPWFKNTYPLKHIKKWLYWPWIEYNTLRQATGVLYTSEEERRSARNSFKLYKAHELVFNYGIKDPAGSSLVQKDSFLRKYNLLGKRILLFLGRIHPVKGCDLLIRAFSVVIKEDPLLQLVIVGPDLIGWAPELLTLSRNLHLSDNITWTGPLIGDLKWGAIKSADCLILPSHSENFGVVVVEALACGIPVIISNKVKIWKEIQQSTAGIICSDDEKSLTQSLIQWLSNDEEKKEEMGINARQCYLQYFNIENNAKKFVEIIKKEL